MKFNSIEELTKFRNELVLKSTSLLKHIKICSGTGCIAAGAHEVFEEFKRQTQTQNVPACIGMRDCPAGHVIIKRTGCQGFCQIGTLVHIMPDDILYCHVKPSDVREIVQETIKGSNKIERLLYKEEGKACTTYKDIPFYKHQTKVVLKGCGEISAYSLEDYLVYDGYLALTKALKSLSPSQIIDEIKLSGLRGRGGAGFSTGRKWESCVQSEGEERFVICNGDEGDPGAFMDCSIMEGDPYRVIEGITIGALAVGAKKGFIYVRDEYPRAVERLNKALTRCYEFGLLGQNILGTDFSLDLQINRGGGAFVCGESTALMRSLEGKVGEPRAKYVRSVQKGYRNLPTVLNNVETWASIPGIINNGAAEFAKLGTSKSKGTKAFCLVGKVKNTGLIEVPMGITLRQIVFDIGGGLPKGRTFKAVQTGGPSGGCIPEQFLDLPVDFDELDKVGSMMGSGGLIVMDNRTCMVDIARYFIHFLLEESCGKCVPCREGLHQINILLTQICNGNGKIEDINQIIELCKCLQEGSLCALGKSAANPVLSTLKYFKDEYIAHIEKKHCPAGVCRALITYSINEKCTACGKCKKVCPVNAISGDKKIKHLIKPEQCIRCGACESVCKFDAVRVS